MHWSLGKVLVARYEISREWGLPPDKKRDGAVGAAGDRCRPSRVCIGQQSGGRKRAVALELCDIGLVRVVQWDRGRGGTDRIRMSNLCDVV